MFLLCASLPSPKLSAATAESGDEASSEQGSVSEQGTVTRILALTEELQNWLLSLSPEKQAELRPQIATLLASMPDPATSTNTEVSVKPSIAAQPAPELEVAVAPVPVVGQPAVTVNEPVEPSKVSNEPGVSSTVDLGMTEPVREPIDDSASLEPIVREPILETEKRAENHSELRPAPSLDSEATTEPAVDGAATTRRGCRTLVPFDTDGDGKLTGLDRYWRHFYLWTDVDGDRKVDEKEIESPFERGIREVNVDLRSFVRGKGKRKRSLEIQLEEHILLDVGGDGWSGAYPRNDDGALAIDAGAIRQAGGPDARDSRGRQIEGVQPFKPSWTLKLDDGSELAINCPRG